MQNNLTDFVNNACSFYIAIAIVLLSTLYYVIKSRGLPPGPSGLPYLGYWPFLSHDNCHGELHKLSKKYGDVFSFTVTGRLFIHFGSIKSLREAHITKADCFAERMGGYNVLYHFLNGGVVFTEFEAWKNLRKFFLQQFRERGMTAIKETLSGPMYDTIKETVTELKATNGEPVDIASLLVNKCNKIMRVTLLGEDGMTEEEMRVINILYGDTLFSMTSKNLMLVGEIARYFIIPYCQGFSKGKKSHVKIREMLYKMINKRKETYEETHVRDVVDGFIKERNFRKSKSDPTAKYFTDRALMVSLIQFIGDGVLFMGMFVGAFITALLDHPDEQEKVYQELVEVCGLDRDPVMEDKSRLPYTNAFITEVMRTTEIFTFFPSLECTKETTIGGYRIPKGAITVYNFYSAHMNTDDYEEPEKFNPSRFIVKDGQKRPDLLNLFGIGKRSCMGEAFAMIQVFLFVTTIVKNFRLSKPPGVKDIKNLFFNSDKINIVAKPRKST